MFAGVDDFAALDVRGLSSCSGSGFNWINLDGYAASWSSDNTAIMTVQPRVVAGVSFGSTTARSELVNIQYGPPRDGQTCPVQNVPLQTPASTGKSLPLEQSSCNQANADGSINLIGTWGTGLNKGCELSDRVDIFYPKIDGGICIKAGTGSVGPINCWRTSQGQCTTTTCVVSPRIADENCFGFIDGSLPHITVVDSCIK